MTVHYPLSPSASERWLNCPGSIDWEQSDEDTSSVYAQAGTAAHELLAARLRNPIDFARPRRCLDCNRWASRDIKSEPVCAECGSKSFYHDDEMYRYVASTLDRLYKLRERCAIVSEHIEQTWLDSEIPNFGGTADYVATYWEDGKSVLHVVDFKFGAGVPVSAVRNPQLLCYLRLVRCAMSVAPDIMRGTITQPRTPGNGWDTYEFSEQEYNEFVAKLRAAAVRSDKLVAGAWCRWCRRATECPALHQIAVQAAAIEFAEPEPSPQLVLQLLEMGPSLKALIDAAPQMALELMERGVELPGWKAVEAVGNRTWICEPADVLKKLAARKIGLKKATTRKLKSPAQLDREGYAEQIDDLVHRPSRGYTVVRDTDRRPAIMFDQQLFPDDLVLEGD